MKTSILHRLIVIGLGTLLSCSLALQAQFKVQNKGGIPTQIRITAGETTHSAEVNATKRAYTFGNVPQTYSLRLKPDRFPRAQWQEYAITPAAAQVNLTLDPSRQGLKVTEVIDGRITRQYLLSKSPATPVRSTTAASVPATPVRSITEAMVTEALRRVTPPARTTGTSTSPGHRVLADVTRPVAPTVDTPASTVDSTATTTDSTSEDTPAYLPLADTTPVVPAVGSTTPTVVPASSSTTTEDAPATTVDSTATTTDSTSDDARPTVIAMDDEEQEEEALEDLRGLFDEIAAIDGELPQLQAQLEDETNEDHQIEIANINQRMGELTRAREQLVAESEQTEAPTETATEEEEAAAEEEFLS